MDGREAASLPITGAAADATAASTAGTMTAGASTIDIGGIMHAIPHRYPFLMIDRVVDVVRNRSAIGVKNVSANEAFFQGHFPNHPVMPGVLIIESIAQIGGLLLLLDVKDRDSKLLYMAGVDAARFRRPVIPGDQLRVEVNVLTFRGPFCKVAGFARVNGELAVEATVMCAMVDLNADGKPERSTNSVAHVPVKK